MILYTLCCENDHSFESWFKDSAAFGKLSAAAQITCGLCGSTNITKSIMAPSVNGTKKTDAPLSEPANPAETALKKLRTHLHQNSDYVGKDFADEARRIHLGEAEARGIWGEATKEDAKSLKDEGIPVAPIPFMQRQDD